MKFKNKISQYGNLFAALMLLLVPSISCGKNGKLRSGNDASPLPPIEGKELQGDKDQFDSFVYSVNKLKESYRDVIVLDARTEDEYNKGHLPNAVHAHWTDWSNTTVKQGEKGWARVLPFEVLKQKLGSLGIDGTRPVIIYGDPLNSWGDEGRQLWTLRYYGLKNSFLLNGGIQAWARLGGEINKSNPLITAVQGPEPKPDHELFVDTENVAEKIGTVNILDVREDREYAGIKDYGEKKKGRIPTAKHIWFKDFYNADGTLQSPSQIRARAESIGFRTEDEVVSYCTGGIRSGFATIALRIAGYQKARNYNGSFSEWAGTGQKIDDKVLTDIKQTK